MARMWHAGAVAQLGWAAAIVANRPDLDRSKRAGDRDRTGMTSLEGYGYRTADQPERRSGGVPVCP